MPLAPGGVVARTALVLVAGNPNAGKSTVFNALTGARAKVGNYPGITVDRKSAVLTLPSGRAIEVIDLPGTYSLGARSREEQVAVDALLGRHSRRPDATVVVADATALARALYLVIEILGTGTPVIVALTMSDEARRKGIGIDAAALARRLGARVVPLVATRLEGVPALVAAIDEVTREPQTAPPHLVTYPPEVEGDIDEVARIVSSTAPLGATTADRAWAEWLLLSPGDEHEEDLANIPTAVRAAAQQVRRRATERGRNLDLEIISERYRVVDAIVSQVVRPPATERRSRTDRLDAILTHRVYGSLAFVAVMLVVFQALFSWSEPAIEAIEGLVAAVQGAITNALPSGPFTSLLVDGVVAGVGNVLVFVPQIALLFLFIGLLEDLGYLARVAFVIDRLMRAVGLHGKAFVPMLSGFSCAVPAVMATRTIENRADRLLTMLVLPLMSCSARLPVYALVTATVFDPSGQLLGLLSTGAVVLCAMYFLSVVATLGAAAVLRRTVLKGPGTTLLLELPPYRLPVWSILARTVWQRVRTFLVDAGTIILALTILLWALLSYPKDPGTDARFAAERARAEATLAEPALGERLAALDGQSRGEQLRHSVAGRVGRVLEPVLEPLGFDWRLGIGILGAFTAREIFVSTLGIVFDISNADESSDSLRQALQRATRPDGSRLMTPLTGVSLMVFFVLACQCMSTIAVVRRESGSWRWPAFMFGYMTVLAYGAAFVVYQTGRLMGLGT